MVVGTQTVFLLPVPSGAMVTRAILEYAHIMDSKMALVTTVSIRAVLAAWCMRDPFLFFLNFRRSKSEPGLYGSVGGSRAAGYRVPDPPIPPDVPSLGTEGVGDALPALGRAGPQPEQVMPGIEGCYMIGSVYYDIVAPETGGKRQVNPY